MIRWSFIPRKADRLLIAPQDLRTADGTRASEIYAGRFAFAGKVVISDGRSPFEIRAAVRRMGGGAARLRLAAPSARRRVRHHPRQRARAGRRMDLACRARWHPVGWQPEILARRITAWLSQAPLILHDADDQFYRRFLRSLVRQVRYLRHTAIEARDGVPRMQALVALTYAALCMAGQARHMRSAIKQLVAEIDRQILPDGGHISRNPGALIELLLDLLPLRQAFAARNIAPPPQLNNAIDRMMPMMRFFRHGDGNFAHFNGMGPTLPDLMATILAYDDARGAPLSNAPHSGYQRIEVGDMLLLMDTGGAAADQREPGGARRLPVVRAVARPAAHRGELRPAAAPTAKPGGRWRAPPRRIPPSCSTTRRRAAFSKAARSSACSARRSSAGRPTSRCRARSAATPSSCARRTTAMPTASGSCTSAR